MKNVEDILGVINLDALNTYNAKRVEEKEAPLSILEAFEKVEEFAAPYVEYLRESLENLKDILSIIDLDALNAYNVERVEEDLPPLTIREAYEKVEDAVSAHAEDLREELVEKAYANIDRFIDHNYLCYEGSDLEYVDNGLFVTAIAQKVRKNLF